MPRDLSVSRGLIIEGRRYSSGRTNLDKERERVRLRLPVRTNALHDMEASP